MTKRQNKREMVWAYATTHAHFTALEVANDIGMDIGHCREIIMLFLNRGYLRYLTGSGVSGDPRKYSVVPGATPQIWLGGNGGIVRHRTKTIRQKIWNSMKISRVFTAKSVCVTSGGTEKAALTYIQKLKKAGYVEMLCQSDRARVPLYQNRQIATFRLIRDTGRKAPIARKDGCFDQNDGVFYPFNKGVKNEQNVA